MPDFTYRYKTPLISYLDPLAQRALDIDPTLAEGHAAVGFSHALALRWREAEASFTHAIDLAPTLSTLPGDYVLAVLLPWGRLEEAIDVLERALRNDPLSLDLRRVLARVQLNARRYDDALANCLRVLEADPTFTEARDFAGWARLFKGERAEALKWLERWAAGNDTIAGTEDDRPGVTGYIHAILGRRVEAEAIAALPRFTRLPQRRAEIYGLLGNKEKVLEALHQLADINPLRAAYQLTVPEVGLDRNDPAVEEFRRSRLGLP